MLSDYKYKSLAKSTLYVIEKLHISEKVYFDQLFGFSNIAFIIHPHFSIMPYLTLRMLDFFNTIRVSNIRPDILSGSKMFAKVISK